MNRKQRLLQKVRDGETMSRRDKLNLVLWLSMPAILGQLSTIVMQYIDTMMVGQLGANATASIGLVSTTCWLFGGNDYRIFIPFCEHSIILIEPHY